MNPIMFNTRWVESVGQAFLGAAFGINVSLKEKGHLFEVTTASRGPTFIYYGEAWAIALPHLLKPVGQLRPCSADFHYFMVFSLNDELIFPAKMFREF